MAAIVLSVGSARAETTPENAAVAEALFREAKELMRAGRFSEACARLAESQRLDPGGGTLLTLASCHEGEGRTATALLEFKESLALARQAARPDRVQLAQEHIRALEAKVSFLTVVVPKEARIEGLELSVDKAPLVPAAWGSAVPIDPGHHAIEARAPGYAPATTEVDIPAVADRRTVTIAPLARGAAPSDVPAVAAAPPAASQADVETPVAAKPSSATTRRTIAFVVGGAGLVSLGVMSVFGLRALSASSDAKATSPNGTPHCDATGCDEVGLEHVSDARSAARIANVTAGIGVVALGTAAVLLLTASSSPKAASASPSSRVRVNVGGSASPSGLSMTIGGTF